MTKKLNNGFTLIELIIVIVILGILAVVSAPRFINLGADSNEAVLEGLSAAMLDAANLVYAKAIIQNVQADATANVDLDGDGSDDIATVFGYPSGNRTTGIANALELGSDWAYSDIFPGAALHVTRASLVGFSGVTNNNIPITQTRCYLTYRPSVSAGRAPTITYTKSGC
ncbi:prepilin-type N-terminal cleavage/methylation domain-containing protein [Arsukibacterium sp.]|uniref:prepilin-type N-terminal cleavage/methylation domain-containing protein n=1 Tax=Arsukibacterium sp. TaxID=1977258 RepID=UPI00356985C5